MKAVKPLSVATSRKYFVAPAEAAQLAVKPEVVFAVAAATAGALGIVSAPAALIVTFRSSIRQFAVFALGDPAPA
jgi:hypothetical protein